MLRRYKRQLLVALWCLFIFIQSSLPGHVSAGESGTLTAILNKALFFLLGDKVLPVSELLLRKAAHFFEYFVLGALLYGALYSPERKGLKTVAFSLLLGGLYAVTDEIHQYFVPERYMSAADVLIDSAGTLLGALARHLLVYLKTHGKRES